MTGRGVRTSRHTARDVAYRFRDDAVAHLEGGFVLPFADVDASIDAQGDLFARFPRAEIGYHE